MGIVQKLRDSLADIRLRAAVADFVEADCPHDPEHPNPQCRVCAFHETGW